jgi:glycosyltransferase involved in cell wall biosynthesis
VLLSRTASVIVLNAHDESWFRRRLPASKVLRLHTGVGVPLSSFPAAHLPATERLALLWVGEFTARKRPFDALEVVRELRRAGISPHLEMLGEGPLLPAVREAIATTGLTDVVTATGRGEVATALARSHLLLHTAAWEGLPRVALEAAAVGRWTYGYDVKGVVDGPASRVVPYGDTRALAHLIAGDVGGGALEPVAVSRDALDPSTAAQAIADFVRSVLRDRRSAATGRPERWMA